MTLPRRILLATSNPAKIAEWRRIAPDVEWIVDPTLPSPDETGATVADNARLKAVAGALRGVPALGDDVGMWVDALGGRPGLDLKPWAEALGGWSAARQALAAVDGSGATYRCGLALAWPDGRVVAVEGNVEGAVGPPRGEGPGVEPCFRPGAVSDRATLSEVDPDTRREVHHRHRAWRRLVEAVQNAK